MHIYIVLDYAFDIRTHLFISLFQSIVVYPFWYVEFLVSKHFSTHYIFLTFYSWNFHCLKYLSYPVGFLLLHALIFVLHLRPGKS